jgi:UDP-N-acetyl-D-mannosaminuronic acid dehydrogenase
LARYWRSSPTFETFPPELTEFDNLRFCDMSEALAEADIAVLLVDHAEFRAIEAKELLNKIVIDTRGFWRDRLYVPDRYGSAAAE